MTTIKGREKLDLGPLPHLLGYALRRAQIAVFADFNAACETLELRPAQFSALLLIEGNPGCKQSDAAEALGIMQPNFVALMDELERRKLARRAPGKTDRRAYALELTEAGVALLAHARTVVADHDARVTRSMSPLETAQLLELLARVEQNASPQTTK
jgi:DNA-binding MarR family transcriptional regulator